MFDCEASCSKSEQIISKDVQAHHSASVDKANTTKCSQNAKAIETNKADCELDEIDDDFLSTASQDCDKESKGKTEISIGDLQKSIKRKQLILQQLSKKIPKGDDEDTDSSSDESC